jgi:hypothetical protein
VVLPASPAPPGLRAFALAWLAALGAAVALGAIVGALAAFTVMLDPARGAAGGAVLGVWVGLMAVVEGLRGPVGWLARNIGERWR